MNALVFLISNVLLYLISPELILLGVLCDLVVVTFGRSKKLFFWYSISKTLTGLLYLSYLLETGMPYTYGGDDQGFILRYIDTSRTLSTKELFSGAYINYPLFYIVNKFLVSFIGFVPIKYVHIALTLFHNILFSLVVRNYSEVLRIRGISKSVLIWTILPIVYFSSIFVRDIYIYCLFSYVFLYLARGDKSIFKLVVLLSLTFLIRPESAIILSVFSFFHLRFNQQVYLLIIGLVLFIYLSPLLSSMFRNYGQLKEIYFNSDVVNESGLAYKIMAMPGTFGAFAWYIYSLFKPLPPFYVAVHNFENFVQILPNLVVYFFVFSMIYTLIFSSRRNKSLSEVWLYLVSVFIMAFIGGTQRHYMHLVVLLVISFFLQNKSVRLNTMTFAFILSPVALLFYTLLA